LLEALKCTHSKRNLREGYNREAETGHLLT